MSRLLALFGGDQRLADPQLNQPLSRERMAEMEQLLQDPSLPEATLQFCNHITKRYSFDTVLEAAIKRCAWIHTLPELTALEEATMGTEFSDSILAYLYRDQPSPETLTVRTLPELGRRIKRIVGAHVMHS